MSIFIKVENQRLIPPLNLGRLVSGSQKFVKFKFGLDNEWDELITFAQFKQETSPGSGSYEAYNELLDADKCACLPAEITSGVCTLTLYGNDGTTKATVNYLELRIDDNNLVVDAQSTDISQSLYEQFVEEASLVFAARDATITARDRAETAANTATNRASEALSSSSSASSAASTATQQATAAANSASSASTSAETATQQATNAQLSAVAAENSATAALNSATDAENSASMSMNKAAEALYYSDIANGAKDTATTKASDAEVSAVSAANSATIAEANKMATEEVLETVNGQIALNAASEATASALQAQESASIATSFAMVEDLDYDRIYTKQFIIQDGHFGIKLTEVANEL